MASFTEEETKMHDNRGYELLVTRYKIFHSDNGITYYGMGYYKKPDTICTRTGMTGFKYLFNEELMNEVYNYYPTPKERWVWSDTRKSWVIQK